MVSSPCPLLSSEVADGILPGSGLQVPPGSAWVPVEVDVTHYSNDHGDLSVFALRECLRRSVEYGESLHDELDWPTAAMRHDAWLNRRLAISVTGIGDLAKMRGLDPQSFVGLKDMGAVLQEIRETVNNYSRKLATDTEPVPFAKNVGPRPRSVRCGRAVGLALSLAITLANSAALRRDSTSKSARDIALVRVSFRGFGG